MSSLAKYILRKLRTLHCVSPGNLLPKDLKFSFSKCCSLYLLAFSVSALDVYVARNVVQHISSYLEHSKIRVLNISGTLSYFCFESIDQNPKFYQVSAVWFVLVTAVSKDDTTTAENYAVKRVNFTLPY